MMRAIWIICLVMAAVVFIITPMDPVEMPVLDVNSLAVVTPDVSSAEREPGPATAKQAAEPSAAQPSAAQASTAQPSEAKPSAAKPSAAKPSPAEADAQQVADAAPAQATVPVNAPEAGDPKLDAAKPGSASQEKPDTVAKSAPAPAKNGSRHRSRAAVADAASQKKSRQRAKMQAEEAIKNATAAVEPAPEPACVDGNTLLRAFNLTPPCRQ